MIMVSPCKFCNGNCCASYVITVNSFDVLRIAEFTGLKPDEFAYLRRLDILVYDDEQVVECRDNKMKDHFILCLMSHPCCFFDGKKCGINSVKPLYCRIFPYDRHGNLSRNALCPFISKSMFRFSRPQ